MTCEGIRDPKGAGRSPASGFVCSGLLVVLCTSAALAEQRWGQWRGPGGDGRAPEFGEVSSWPGELELVWRISAGEGHASPVVGDGLVCLHSRVETREVVSCYELESGAERWSHSYPVTFKAAMGGGRHGAGPKATPALRDGRLFSFGITGVLSTWQASNGALLWRRDFGDEYQEAWPRWGIASSPLVVEGQVVVHAGRKAGAVVAHGVQKGEELWRLEGFGASYASPILVELDGVRQIVALAAEGLLGLGLDGELLWRYEYRQSLMRQNIPSPVSAGNRIVLASKGRPTLALGPRRKNSEWSVAELWENGEIPQHMSTAVFADGQLCGLSSRRKGLAFCADGDTGELRWRSDPRFGEHASVVWVPGALLFFTPEGRLRVLDPGDGYRELASYRVAESEVWAHPAILTQSWIVRSHDELLYWRLPSP